VTLGDSWNSRHRNRRKAWRTAGYTGAALRRCDSTLAVYPVAKDCARLADPAFTGGSVRPYVTTDAEHRARGQGHVFG
jgi:hypothetical protein